MGSPRRVVAFASACALVVVLLIPGLSLSRSAWATETTHERASPARTHVTLYFREGDGVVDTGVVKAGGHEWLATDVVPAIWFGSLPASIIQPIQQVVRIYEWVGGKWLQRGMVKSKRISAVQMGGFCKIPYGLPGPQDCFRSALLTGGKTPDFVTSWCCGADSPPTFSVIGDVHGRWKAIPFDTGGNLQEGGELTVWGWVHPHAVAVGGNSCGCADGVESETWFRFAGQSFVPTNPPGRVPACTSSALLRAGPIYSGKVDNIIPGTLPGWFRAGHHACLDGWALASVGRHRFVLFMAGQLSPYVHRVGWLRVGVGSWSALQNESIAVPAIVVRRLGAAVTKRLVSRSAEVVHSSAKRRPQRSGPGYGPLVRTQILPASSFAEGTGTTHHDTWMVVAMGRWEPAPGTSQTISVDVYRMTRTRWALTTRLKVRIPSPMGQDAVSYVESLPKAPSWAPTFVVAPSPGDPNWMMSIGRTNGRWHVMQFYGSGSSKGVVEAPDEFDNFWYPKHRAGAAYVTGHVKGLFRIDRGRWVMYAKVADPPCTLRALRAQMYSRHTRLQGASVRMVGQLQSPVATEPENSSIFQATRILSTVGRGAKRTVPPRD